MWYYAFLLTVTLLALFGTHSDRPAMRVILAATVVSAIVTPLLFNHIPGDRRMIGPAAVEFFTALALWRWAPGRTGNLQILAVFAAWCAAVLVYVDVDFYENYVLAIKVVALIQLGICYDSWLQLVRSAGRWLHQIGPNHGVVGPAPSLRARPGVAGFHRTNHR